MSFYPATGLVAATLLMLAHCGTAQGGTIWDGGGADTNINTATNWDSDTLPTSLTDGTQTLTFGTGGSNATINTSVNALGLVINRDGNFTISNGAGNLTIGAGGITVTLPNTTARTHTISESNLILAGNQTWSVTNNSGAAVLIVSSAISGANFGITKNGSGQLTLTGTNTFTGGIVINAGRVDSNSSALGTGNVTIASGAFMGLTSTGTYSNNFTIAGAGTGSGAIQVPFSTGNFTISGLTTLTGDATVGSRGQASASGSNLIFAGGITTGGANRTLTLSVLATSTFINNAITISTNSVNLGTGGTLDIAAATNSDGTGTVNLNVGNNTWGTLIVKAASTAGASSNGTLNLGAANALGGSGAVLQLGSTTTALENITVNLNGNNQTIGGLRSFGSTGSASANGTRTVTSATAATLTIDNSSATSYLYDGVVSGGISLVKNGSATQTLAGNNTYTGATTVNAGTLSTGSADRISDSSAVTVASGATFLLGGSETVGSIAGAGNYSIAGFTLTAGGDNTSTEVSGNITGASGALTKSGAGTLVLSGNNTYTGATTINAGTLEIASTGRLGGGSYTGNIVNNGSFTFNGSSAQTLSGNISGSGGLTKNNSSTLTLTGTNTFTGGIVINAGRVDSVSSALGTGNVTIASGAFMGLTSTGTYSNNFTIAGAGTGSGVIQAPFSTGNFTISGLTTLTGDATVGSRGQASASGSNLIFAGGITTGGANRTLTSDILTSGRREPLLRNLNEPG